MHAEEYDLIFEAAGIEGHELHDNEQERNAGKQFPCHARRYFGNIHATPI